MAKRQRREIHFPTGRFGEAIELAQAVLFLASDESSFVNGTDFVVDGGMSKVRFNIAIFSTPPPRGFLACLEFEEAEEGSFAIADVKLCAIKQAYVTPEGPATAAPSGFAK